MSRARAGAVVLALVAAVSAAVAQNPAARPGSGGEPAKPPVIEPAAPKPGVVQQVAPGSGGEAAKPGAEDPVAKAARAEAERSSREREQQVVPGGGGEPGKAPPRIVVPGTRPDPTPR
jgi:hypothetical protein